MKPSDENFSDIFRFLDGEMSEQERIAFSQRIENDESLRRTVELIRGGESVVRDNWLRDPSPSFTQQVMQSLHGLPGKQAFSLNGILLVAGIFVVGVICALFLSRGWMDGASATIEIGNTVPRLTQIVPQNTISIGLNGKVMVSGIIFINAVLALILLDRTVLKPYFQERIRKVTSV